jgi:hypothetical protein
MGGSIKVSLRSNIDPGIGENFNVLTAGAINGSAVAASKLPALLRLPLLTGAKMFRAHLVNGRMIQLTVVSLDLDARNDGVTCADYSIVRSALGTRSGQPGFDARADINGDGVVDVRDLSVMAQKLPAGTRCS